MGVHIASSVNTDHFEKTKRRMDFFFFLGFALLSGNVIVFE